MTERDDERTRERDEETEEEMKKEMKKEKKEIKKERKKERGPKRPLGPRRRGAAFSTQPLGSCCATAEAASQRVL